MAKPIKVLICEDSMFFQEIMKNGINADPGLEVVAVATNPFEARDAIIKYRPDVMTLDIELPRMDGIEFLRQLLPQYSIPVVMVSSLSNKVFEALKVGAVDFVAKPATGSSGESVMSFITNELCPKIKVASTVQVTTQSRFFAERPEPSGQSSNRIIAIGASTGGTEAIYEIIRNFKRDIPGVIVVQHMPAGFTAMYSQRLNNDCEVFVKEAHDGDVVRSGQVLIANGAEHLRLVKEGGGYRVECKPGPKVSGHCPSVDVMFESVAQAAGANAIGVILTGMGADGANGLLAMRKAGAQTIGQDEATCVVYGMPKVAYDIGAVKEQLPLGQIASRVYALLR